MKDKTIFNIQKGICIATVISFFVVTSVKERLLFLSK